MKAVKKLLFLLSLGVLSLSACGSNPSSSGPVDSSSAESTSSYNPEDDGPYTGVGPYVKKVANMPDDFVIGMDSSSVLSLEESGVKYYDFDGTEKDLFVILAGQGINTIRIRIWVDPWTADGHGYGGGNVDIDRAVTIGKRATAAGLKVLANFHYSDFWADPGRQLAPKAWEGKTLDQKIELLSAYTVESMQKFKDNNVDISMVQIGNETTGGMAGEKHLEDYSNFARMVTAGTRAVKSVYPNAQTIVHFTNPEKGAYGAIAGALKNAGAEYDIFGTSYYPFFHGTLDNLVTQLNAANRRSGGKKVMVMETSYAYTDEDTDFCANQFSSTSSYDQFYPVTQGGQIANFRNICDALVNRVNNHAGSGVCYWEGTWISVNQPTWEENKALWDRDGSGWASDYAAEYDPEVEKYGGGGTVVDNQCFFDKTGHPLESLKMFKLLKTGNRTEEWIEGAESTGVEFMTNEEIKLPATVRAIYNSDNRRDTAVTWDVSKAYSGDKTITLNGDINKLKDSGPGSYTVNGVIKDGDKSFSVTCTVRLDIANYIKNPSFEDGEDNNWEIKSNDELNKGYLIITNQNANNPISGKWDVHGYSVDGHMNYEVTQGNITASKDAPVKFRFFVTGGANESPVPESAQKMYAYILEDDVEIKKVDFKITKWGDIHQVDAEGITLKPGKTYKVGFHVELDSPGVWIDIDDVNLYE
ncbi:MAG: arabinogalactan endo-1,4-beta-galactosidase [Erysipelotrichaceae bacterium]|nr:arabinogalactan endo-1,4-beta-galactosidase [Erysipelotrichaceae bacterium]